MTLPDRNNTARTELTEPYSTGNRLSRNIIFLLVGSAFFSVYVLGFVMPLAKAISARNWQPTPCTVLESELQTNDSSDGATTYSLALKYGYYAKSASGDSAPDYKVGTRYDFQSAADSNEGYWRDLAKILQPGNPCTCYVDPTDLSQAVLNVSLGRPLWQAILWSPLALIPLAMPWFWWREKKYPVSRWHARKRWLVAVREVLTLPRKGTTLKGGDTAANRIFQVVLLVIFIVGFGSAATALIAAPFSPENSAVIAWVSVPLGIVFGGISLLMAVAGLFGSFDQRLLLELDHTKLLLGQTAKLGYRATGKLQRLRSINVHLCCNYVVPVSDSAPDDRFPLYEKLLLELDGPFPVLEGNCLVPIPKEGPSTVQVESGRIEWEVRLSLIPIDGKERLVTLVFPVESEPFQLQATQQPQNVNRCDPKTPLELILEPSAPGVLKGKVLWNLRHPISSIDLRLFWYTEGQSSLEPAVAAAATAVSATTSVGHAPFSLQIPATPRPYQSDKINVRWAIEAIARPSGVVTRLDLVQVRPTTELDSSNDSCLKS